MATLIEVRNALKNGDKATARQLLKQVLQEKPSADAWFLAAKLSDSRESTIKNLQRALVMDPNHGQSKRMLEDLGGKQVSGLKALTMDGGGGAGPASGGLMGRLAALPRWVMAVLFGVVFLLMVCMIGSMIASNSPPPPVPTWTPRPYGLWNQDILASHFRLYPQVSVTEVGGAVADTPVQGRVVLELPDAGGVVQQVRIFIYNTEDDAWNDQPRLQGLGWSEFVFNQNAVMVFPTGLDDGTQRRAVDVLDSAIDPQQVQAAVTAATATAAAPTPTPEGAGATEVPPDATEAPADATAEPAQ